MTLESTQCSNHILQVSETEAQGAKKKMHSTSGLTGDLKSELNKKGNIFSNSKDDSFPSACK